ncbi:hypothetical protein [uncultured Fibrobacter sp.]|jgi:hypothetical protein|uniref:hypothetical protein n=1 Tax=Fibrobacter sp. TaxID=35828 RepID=UPI0013D15175|nr:hypothetical protein [uncultured Fibrobacter sp.]
MIVAELEPVVASRKSNTLRENFDRFGEEFSDGRLTEPSPTERHFRLHEAIAYSNSLGRPLTEQEMKLFEI